MHDTLCWLVHYGSSGWAGPGMRDPLLLRPAPAGGGGAAEDGGRRRFGRGETAAGCRRCRQAAGARSTRAAAAAILSHGGPGRLTAEGRQGAQSRQLAADSLTRWQQVRLS